MRKRSTYINQLKKLISDLSERDAVYVPALDDKIDLRLSEWIKSSKESDKYKKLFIREGDGVY